MANWKKHIVVNAILGKVGGLTDDDPWLRRNAEFLRTVARHILALCVHEGWSPEIDGLEPDDAELIVADITHIDDFDSFLQEVYDAADRDLIWLGLDGDDIPKFRHSELGWLGDFSAFATEGVSNGH
jgi:hypothetical protein